MKKELREYINRERNVVRDEFIISREKTGNGSELIFVNTPDIETPLYALWNYRRETKVHKLKKTDRGYVIERTKPKGTGGKPAYVMVMLAELSKLKISIEASGLLLKLFLWVEWNTCRLTRKRTINLTRKMISEQFGLGELKVKRLLSELREAGALEYKGKAYYVNKTLVRKGRL